MKHQTNKKGKEAEATQFQSPITTVVLVLNVMLGTGPIIIPPVFMLAGLGLSTLFMFIICFFSYLASEFVIEAMAICNFLNPTPLLASNYSESENEKENEEIRPLSQNEKQETVCYSTQEINNEYQQQQEQEVESENQDFNFRKVYNYGDIGGEIMGKWGKIISSIMIIAYLFGTIVSKCIMTGKIMMKVFEDFSVVNNYYFWLSLFFFSSAILSFKDIGSIKIVQNIIGLVRAIVIILFIAGPVYLISQNGSLPLVNLTFLYPEGEYTFVPFNFEAFAQLFSNLTFAFMVQHSVSNMVGQNRPEKSLKKVILAVYLLSFLSCYLISILGMLAFGGEETDPYNMNDLIYFNLNFKSKIDWIYYFTSFYIFLNIAALPVLTIVLRNNLIKLITPQLFPKKSHQLTKYTLIYTLGILIAVFGCALLLRHYIQYVLNITGGLCGVCLMLTLPSLFVIQGRKLVAKKSQSGDLLQQKNIHKALLGMSFIPYCLFSISLVLFGYNFYLSMKNFFKGGGH